jgi:A/G-specific adenine glycosylase
LPDSLVNRLSAWYAGEKHRYEFRLERNPYRTWITEIFLQQTQIAAGKEKLKTFLKRFPDVKTLAKGPIADVLTAFQGMGYYSRARNMHKAAVEIVKKHKGEVPVAYGELTGIAGIGHYTAAIVASIHGGEKILALDANHARVLSRLYQISEPQGGQKFKEISARTAAPLFESKMSAGDVNEALMQWGQLICKKTPLCEKCFAADFCGAYSANRQRDYPKKVARAEPLEILWLMFVHRNGSKYQVFENSEKFPFLRGELMFPAHIVVPPKGNVAMLPEKIPAALVKKTLGKAQNLPVDFKHTITRYKISVKLMFTDTPQPGGKFLTPAELKDKCHSSLMQKAIRRLDKLEF